jgi:NTE family protein
MSRIGLVFGAGGIAGHAYHAGVLDALAATTGWDPADADVVVGTSAGSAVAALLRGGMSPADIARRAAGEPLSAAGARLGTRTGSNRTAPPHDTDDRHAVGARNGGGGAGRALVHALAPSAPRRFLHAALQPWNARLGTLAAAALPEGRVPTDRVIEGLRRIYPEQAWPAAALWICAVRLHDGRRVVFGRDPGSTAEASVPDAVAASCAIPAFFTPVRIGGVRHVDGGAWSPSNADVLAGRGLDLVIVLSPMSARRTIPITSVDGAVRAACRLQLTQEVLRVRHRGTPVVVLEPGDRELAAMGSSAQAMDPERGPAIMRTVRETMRQRLRQPELRERLRALRG